MTLAIPLEAPDLDTLHERILQARASASVLGSATVAAGKQNGTWRAHIIVEIAA